MARVGVILPGAGCGKAQYVKRQRHRACVPKDLQSEHPSPSSTNNWGRVLQKIALVVKSSLNSTSPRPTSPSGPLWGSGRLWGAGLSPVRASPLHWTSIASAAAAHAQLCAPRSPWCTIAGRHCSLGRCSRNQGGSTSAKLPDQSFPRTQIAHRFSHPGCSGACPLLSVVRGERSINGALRGPAGAESANLARHQPSSSKAVWWKQLSRNTPF